MNDDEPTRPGVPDPAFEIEQIALAKQIRACADLNRVRTARLIYRALDRDQQPVQIAADLKIPADTINRTARQIRAGHDPEEVRPSEIINMYVAGEISGRTMLWRLVVKTYTAGRYDPSGGDHYIRGDWDEIQSAVGRGLISKRHYQWLLANCDFTGDGKGWSRRSNGHEDILKFGLFGVDLVGFAQAADLEAEWALDHESDAMQADSEYDRGPATPATTRRRRGAGTEPTGTSNPDVVGRTHG